MRLSAAMAAMQDLQRFGILSGFQRGTDWRPTEFVDALPPLWVCSLCGRITEETATLPCSHRLCLPCFQGCRGASTPEEDARSFSCVLDGTIVPRDAPLPRNQCDAEAVFALKVGGPRNSARAALSLIMLSYFFFVPTYRRDCKPASDSLLWGTKDNTFNTGIDHCSGVK